MNSKRTQIKMITLDSVYEVFVHYRNIVRCEQIERGGKVKAKVHFGFFCDTLKKQGYIII